MILSILANIVTNKDRKKATKKFDEIEKKKNLSAREKENIYGHLLELVNTINEKEEYKYHDSDDLDYYRIRDIENLFDNDNDNDNDDAYYKSTLVEICF